MRFYKSSFHIIGLLAFAMGLPAQDFPDKGKPSPRRVSANLAGAPQYASFSINNITSWVRSDGVSASGPGNLHGTSFPRGTADVIYQDGFLWGGKAYVDAAKFQPAPFGQTIRVGGAIYATGCRPGSIIGFGANATPADTNAADSRIYRIRRDYFTMPADELRRDAAAVYEVEAAVVTEAQMQAVRAQYGKDWNEWPVSYGAPFIDRNRNGTYDPPPAFSNNFTVDSLIAGKYDEPGIAGADPNFPADQVIWTVYNDRDRIQTTSFYGSEPLGLEAQVTLWGYKNSPSAGDFFFRRTRLINKGGVAIDSANTKGAFFIDSLYVGQWADVDLGSFADDLLGCDTLRSMGYSYNSSNIDAEYRKFNLPPPALGYDIVQGPRVPAVGASGIFDLQRLFGWKNLAMTSFSPKSTGSAIADPPGGNNYQFGTLRWYNWLRGFLPIDGREQLYPFPPGITPSFFPLSGDPVAGVGLIDGLFRLDSYSLGPGDRRMTISSGPIRFAPGDTQEVVIAVVAGLGADRFSSIVAMRHVDDFAQSFYNSLLAISPHVRRAGDPSARPEFNPFIINRTAGYAYQNYVKSIPFSAWDIETNPPRRLMVGHLENNTIGGLVDGKYWPPTSTISNFNSSGPREWFFIFDVPYSETPDPQLTQNILGSQMPIMWFGTPNRNGNIAFAADDEFLIQARHFVTSQDVWLFNPTQVGIKEIKNQPYTFELAQNYPNPFSTEGRSRMAGNPTIHIAFSIPVAAKVTLKIYNLLGQEVATLVDERLDAGKHLRIWNGTDYRHRPLGSGIYFYRLAAGELRETKKLVLLK